MTNLPYRRIQNNLCRYSPFEDVELKAFPILERGLRLYTYRLSSKGWSAEKGERRKKNFTVENPGHTSSAGDQG